MAAEPRTYLAAAIIIGVFSLVGLFGGIAIPLIERGKLNSQITSDQMLTREQSLAWGSVPGTRNINYQKTFTIFSLNGTDSTDILQGRANLVEVASATYNYTYQYSKLQFTPATNGSVQFYNFYNHTYEGANETDLMNQMVSTVDIGIFRGITQQANMSPAQIFVQSLYRIYTSFQQDIVTLLISEYVYQFYIKDKDLTYSTIFLYNNTVSQDLADALWNDAEYGWSKSDTLLPWVALSMNYNTGATSYNPANNPEYTLLKSHFGLTDAQMLALINGNYAAPSVPSMLYLVIYAVQNAVSGVNGCQLTTGCTNIEMFAAQFFVGNITKNPAFEGVAPKDSIAQINETYPIAPEIAAVNPQNVDFGSTLPGQLFNLNGNLPANTVQTLFGLQNIEMILANQNNTQAVTTNMNLDNTQQAQVLIDYVNYIINEFAYFGQNNTQAAKYTADVAVNNINNLIGDMGGLMSINLTAMGTYNYMLHQGQNCSVLLQGLDPSIIQAACSNPDYTLDSAHGQASWIAAYFAGDGSTAYTLIEGATGIADSDLQYMLTNQSNAWVPSNATALFYANIQAVISAMAQAFGCGQGPCDNTFISKVQWATSGVTSKLPIPYFPQTYESLSDIPAFQPHFGLFVPEFTVFAKRVLNQNINMTLDQANALLSYDSGSINNNYEMLRLVMMAQSSNYTGIQERFNLDQSETATLFAYLDSAFMNYTLGGLIQNVSAYDLLWGYTDPFLETLNNQNFFDNIQIFNAEVSVLGGKDNSDDSSDVPYNMINSGSDNSQNVRQMTAYNGNATLSLNQTHFDGNNYFSAFEPVWNGDLQYITGTDGSGFAPLLETNTPVSIFEGPFLRNLNYNYQTTITKEYNSHSYDFNQYQFDTTQLTASNIYLNNVDGYMNLTVFDNTPLLISLPYFKACAPSSYSAITFSNQDPNTFQSSVDPGTITVEALTGITDTFTKSYQYNIYNSLPFFLNTTNNVAAIPLFQVTEKYTTPVANYERDLQSYYSRSKGITIAMIVVLVISFLLMVTSGVLFRLYHVNRKKLDASRLNANPGDYASLGVDSDGARSSLHPLTQG